MKDSIFHCDSCKYKIKVALCPSCTASYSIAFESIQSKEYSLNCKKCNSKFAISFPEYYVQQNIKQQNVTHQQTNKNHDHTSLYDRTSTGNKSVQHKTKQRKETHNKTDYKTNDKIMSENRNRAEEKVHDTFERTDSELFSLNRLYDICSSAFNKKKLLFGALGVGAFFVILLILNWLESSLYFVISQDKNKFIWSLINLIPAMFAYYIFILTGSVISFITIKELSNKNTSDTNFSSIVGKNWLSLLLNNFTLLFIINALLILVGEVPVVGPLLFALLFLPIYVISICIIIFLAIGMWFYPPIIASGSKGFINHIKELLKFIKKHNFKLVYNIPLMMIVTGLSFSIVYLFHYGSLYIISFLAKNILSTDGLKIFSAIPTNILKFSEITISASSLFKSLFGELILTHMLGGIIIGVIILAITIFLYAIFISLAGTISTYFYMYLEKDIKLDEKKKIYSLATLALILLIILLLKKLIT